MLQATAEVQSLFMDFKKEMAMPQMKSQFALMWAQLPADMKEKFAAEKPEEYAALMNSLKGDAG